MRRGTTQRPTSPSTARRASVVAIAAALLVAACGDDDASTPVDAAQVRVTAAEKAVADAETGLDDAHEEFCADAETYITAVDGYGKVFDDTEATVGDVTAAGEDLVQPREAVKASGGAVVDARDELAAAEQELADAQAALAAASAPGSAAGTTAASATTTTVALLPEATVDRVEAAEEEWATASRGIDDDTPLSEASAELNSAAFALEVAWLGLFADAGCFTDEQQAQAQAAVHDYTVALQTALTTLGYYDGAIDGVYGPGTVTAVKALQKESGVKQTGYVDAATTKALQDAGGDAAAKAAVYTTAVQTMLKLTGYWTGAVDGTWTPELTTAVKRFQTDLGIEPTGVVDSVTLSALSNKVAEDKATAASTTTTAAATSTTAAATTTTKPTTAPTTAAPATTTTAAATSTTAATTSSSA